MESIGELIEKLVIANIKLWMVKDAQAAIACQPAPELSQVQSYLSTLARADHLSDRNAYGPEEMKLFLAALSNIQETTSSGMLESLRALVAKDIELCEARAALRRAINSKLADATPSDTVKQYADRT